MDGKTLTMIQLCLLDGVLQEVIIEKTIYDLLTMLESLNTTKSFDEQALPKALSLYAMNIYEWQKVNQ
jgi:hypothetical protein